jgi:hypothetical protein
MRRLVVAIGAVLVLVVGVTAALAATGDERIYTCVNNGDGTIRQVAGADVACPRNWHKLSWSAENPPATKTTTYTKTEAFAIPGVDTLGAGSVLCDDGDVATGGGYRISGGITRVTDSRPATDEADKPIGWRVVVEKPNSNPSSFAIDAVCQHTE